MRTTDAFGTFLATLVMSQGALAAPAPRDVVVGQDAHVPAFPQFDMMRDTTPIVAREPSPAKPKPAPKPNSKPTKPNTPSKPVKPSNPDTLPEPNTPSKPDPSKPTPQQPAPQQPAPQPDYQSPSWIPDVTNIVGDCVNNPGSLCNPLSQPATVPSASGVPMIPNATPEGPTSSQDSAAPVDSAAAEAPASGEEQPEVATTAQQKREPRRGSSRPGTTTTTPNTPGGGFSFTDLIPDVIPIIPDIINSLPIPGLDTLINPTSAPAVAPQGNSTMSAQRRTLHSEARRQINDDLLSICLQLGGCNGELAVTSGNDKREPKGFNPLQFLPDIISIITNVADVTQGGDDTTVASNQAGADINGELSGTPIL